MKVRKVLVFPATLLLATLSTISLSTILYQRASWAVTTWVEVHLSGTGPVPSSPFLQTVGRKVTVTISNNNNLNIGWYLKDEGTGRVIANGTIKSQGEIVRHANTEPKHTYILWLECQEPIWNDTKCHGKGTVGWNF